jgi:sulfoxide reductase heme-binding subunit YedZ
MILNNKKYISSLAWVAVLLPLIMFAWGFYRVQFAGDILYYGAEPGKAIVHIMGQWSVGFLLVVLAVTPLRTLGLVNLVFVRRRLGLAVFVYAALHLLMYLLLLLGLEFGDLAADIQKRPYILVGFAAFILLTPMAITSTKKWQRRMGRKWKVMHRSVYVVGLLVLFHLWWQVKAGFGLAFIITALMLIIFLFRFKPFLLASFKSSPNL